LNRKTNAKILSIEDDRATIKLLTITLERKGYSVISATRGDEGFQVAKSEAPQLILLDLMLPGINGLALLKMLRSAPETQDIPIVIISAKNQKSVQNEALQAGADAYIIKPFQIRQLLDVIGTLL
jgi:DNA-binding response OmpR family regulator